MNLKEKRSLVAYFSRKGNNYVNGSIVNLEVGNTEVAATMIQEITGCDLFNIDTVESYPVDYTICSKIK